MTSTNQLKMSLLIVGLGILLVLGVQAIAGSSSLDEPVSSVNDWMMGDGDHSQHMMGDHEHNEECDEDQHEEYHENETHKEHHETHHGNSEDQADDCH
ncbi:MAG: hypothetical protein ACE5OZ_18135 [Candidatus Heimdallarchaeota archaeon]